MEKNINTKQVYSKDLNGSRPKRVERVVREIKPDVISAVQQVEYLKKQIDLVRLTLKRSEMFAQQFADECQRLREENQELRGGLAGMQPVRKPPIGLFVLYLALGLYLGMIVYLIPKFWPFAPLTFLVLALSLTFLIVRRRR
ncbi:MAG: hypothetical protein HYT79_11730 [Elusimicrobia bacterium]|nr:hypothetical protein [Elusimicrobiota bacterium]